MDEHLSCPNTRFYFAYGSNLWQHQMQQRCRTSKLVGPARLTGYRWFISETGSANIIDAGDDASTFELVYSLQSADEEVLDSREGVPQRHAKKLVIVELWPPSSSSSSSTGSKRVEALVYINHKNVQNGEPKKEYVYRMNQGIVGGLSSGMPIKFVDNVMREFIPASWDKDVEEEANRWILVSSASDARNDGHQKLSGV